MADITAVQGTEGFVEHIPTATAVAGDLVVPLSSSKDLIILFDNTAVGAVTVDITPSTTAGTDLSAGKWTKAALSLSIPASEQRNVVIKGTQLSAYLDGAGKVPCTYTSHDVGLLISAITAP